MAATAPRTFALLLAGLVLAGPVPARGEEPAPAPPPALPEEEPPVAVQGTADGQHRLELRRVAWLRGEGSDGGNRLGLCFRLRPLAKGEYRVTGAALRGVVAAGPEGPPVPLAAESLQTRTMTYPDLEIDVSFRTERPFTRMEGLELEVDILRVDEEGEVVLEVPGPGETAGGTGRWPMTADAGPQVCEATLRAEDPLHLLDRGHPPELEARDARGGQLVALLASSGDGRREAVFARPPGEAEESPEIAYPVSIRARVPLRVAARTAGFGFKDLDLPPRDEVTRIHVDGEFPGPDADDDLRWTGWTPAEKGLSLCAALPPRAERGDRLPAHIVLRFDPASLPAGVTHLDAGRIEDSVRLLFRNRETGATVEVEDDNEKVIEVPTFEGDPESTLAALEERGWIPLAGGGERSWEIGFLLARAWDALPPGEWEVRVALEEPSLEDCRRLWAGRLVSDPLPLAIEEAPPRLTRFPAPRALRLAPGRSRGTVDVVFGPRESEVVAIETRNGFDLAVEVETERGSGLSGLLWPAIDPVIATLSADHTGPLEGTWTIRLLEAPADSGLGLFHFHGRGRILWERTLRLRATAEEVDAMRR
ncbi:MAG: hypothetical protein HUU06_03380 [Planctomycetaceae bacterium]|nr:hypothetical protein [Planctomycetota bacterium]NUN51817.1 hypothetical protein [Planctomycetaceae bacterium]